MPKRGPLWLPRKSNHAAAFVSIFTAFSVVYLRETNPAFDTFFGIDHSLRQVFYKTTHAIEAPKEKISLCRRSAHGRITGNGGACRPQSICT